MSLLSTSSSSTISQPTISQQQQQQAKNSSENVENNTTTNQISQPTTPTTTSQHRLGPLILQAPQPSDILFFNESSLFESSNAAATLMMLSGKHSPTVAAVNNSPQTPPPSSSQYPRPIVKKSASSIAITSSGGGSSSSSNGKRVRFPEEGDMRSYSEAPKRGWHPGKHSTSDLLDAYIRACDKHKCKPLAKLVQQLKALQDLDCANGEKVNVLNLKSEKLDSKQVEALEEVFKRLSFKTIDLEASQFEDDTTGSTLFEILDYYDTCERLILANVKGMGLYGWQELAKYCRKTISLENLDLRGAIYTEIIYFTYLARSFRLTQSLRVLHLENSSLSGRLLIMLAAAMRDNEQIRELHLADNKFAASTDGAMLASIVKEARAVELLDLRGNTSLGDLGLSYVCSALSVEHVRLKHLVMANCGLTQAGVPYLCKALVQNQSLLTLNIGANSLTNESIFELKQALLVNRRLETLYLHKSKLSDEGCVALAEYIAETRTLKRLDLRENDIRLGGLMALASSLKFNDTLEQVDLDREPKREQSIRDSVETSKRFLADINEFCVRNKRTQAERDRLREEQQKLEETIQEEEKQITAAVTAEANNNTENGDITSITTTTTTTTTVSDSNSKEEDTNESIRTDDIVMEETRSEKTATSTIEDDETAIDVIAKDDELLKRILHRTFSPAPNLHSPITPVDLPNAYFAQFAIKDLADATESSSEMDISEPSSPPPPPTSSSSSQLVNNSCANMEEEDEDDEIKQRQRRHDYLDGDVIALIEDLLTRVVNEEVPTTTDETQNLVPTEYRNTLTNGGGELVDAEDEEKEKEKEKEEEEEEEDNNIQIDEDSDSDSDIEVLATANSPPSPPQIATTTGGVRSPVMPPTPEFTPLVKSDEKRRCITSSSSSSSSTVQQSTPIKASNNSTAAADDEQQKTGEGSTQEQETPFFDSRLTNSQLTEELSQEIGLFN